MRARHGGFGSVQASVQSETIAATASPKSVLILASVSAPPLILYGVMEQACNRLILGAVMFDQLLDLRRAQIERQIVSSNRDRCLQSRFAATLKYPLQWLSLRLLDEALENA